MTHTCANPEYECPKPAKAVGLCAGCYSRQRRRGILKRKYMVNRGSCTVDGCTRKAFAKNLCGKHYQQADGGMKAIWRNLRTRYPDDYPAAWDAYEAFIRDVGAKPSPKHQLRRIDVEIPWRVGNFEWRGPVDAGNCNGTREERAAYSRAWSYLRKYGLTTAQIAAMEAAQGGICPICERPLRRLHPDTGKPVRICLDHDHLTGAHRTLLDDDCNKALGMLDDVPERCDRAGTYLRSHRPPSP